MLPPQVGAVLCTLSITIVPALCQLLLLTPAWPRYLEDARKDEWKRVYHELADPEDVWAALQPIQIIYAVLLVLSAGSLVVTAVTEPGIIPRNSDDLLADLQPQYRQVLDKSESLRFFINKKQLIK